jgi:CRISPR-associated protein Csx10
MKKIKMIIELQSDALSGSGEGFGAVIDTDVEYDECGIPFMSSKRIKGCLRNSLYDLLEMPAVSTAKKYTRENKNKLLNSVFGVIGSVQSSSFGISDFFIEDYETVKAWFAYLKSEYPGIISNERILSTFTNIRRQTKVDDKGIAEEHSLRTSRVVNKGLKFIADITFENEDKETQELFALACANLKRIGTKRNRGLGEIKCMLDPDILSGAVRNLEKTLEEK